MLARSEAVGSVASLWPDGWRERFTVQVAGSGRELQRRRQLLSYNFQEGVRVAFFHSLFSPAALSLRAACWYGVQSDAECLHVCVRVCVYMCADCCDSFNFPAAGLSGHAVDVQRHGCMSRVRLAGNSKCFMYVAQFQAHTYRIIMPFIARMFLPRWNT